MELPTVAAISSDYRYLWVDANWSRVHGFPEEQVLGRTLSEVWGVTAFQNKYKQLLDRALLGEALVQRLHTRTKEGRKRTVQVHLAPVHPPAQPGFVVSTVSELSDLALEGRWNSMFQGEKAMNLLLSGDGHILQFSPALCAYLAPAETDLEGKSLIQLLESSQSDDVVDEFYQALRKAIYGAEQVFEVTLARGQAGLGDFQFSVLPRMNGGTLEEYHVSAFEVTDRNANLRASEDQLQSLFNIAPAPMLIGREGTIVQANAAALAMLGAETEQALLGTSIAQLFPSLIPDPGAGIRLRRQDGVFLQVQLSVTPILRGGRYHQLYLLYNLSEQRQIQEALQAATASAELASRAKSSFLTTVSHEIRTPLNGILGLLYLLHGTGDEQKRAAYLAKLDQTTRDLLAIINDVLDYSVHESGGDAILQVEDFQLGELLTELEGAMRSWQGAERCLEIRIQVAPEVPQRLRGDAGKLRRVLFNLGHNAVRFTPSGKVELQVLLLEQSDLDCTLQFCLSDSGIGIEPEALKRLFTPFQQADSSASRSYGGMGLGLFLSQRFVEILGGTIQAQSEPGRGSQFTFSVCLACPSRQGQSSPERARSPGSISGLQGRVLVVDDNDINQEVAAEMLRQLGLQVEVAGGGRQALELAKRAAYDAILMDLQMPGMDGLEAAARLREQGATMPILALTANTRLEDRQACRQAGMDDFLAKPVELHTLSQALRRFLPAGELATPRAVDPLSASPWPPGIDWEQGLERLGGNHVLYRSLLVQFAQRNQDCASRLEQALEGGDFRQVREISHGLKGSAANLGLQPLSELSAQAEAAARAESITAAQLQSLRRELERLLPQLLELAVPAVTVSTGEVDTIQLQAVLTSLSAQLSTDLGESFRLAEQVESLTRGTALQPVQSRLQVALDGFELDQAREILSELMALLPPVP